MREQQPRGGGFGGGWLVAAGLAGFVLGRGSGTQQQTAPAPAPAAYIAPAPVETPAATDAAAETKNEPPPQRAYAAPAESEPIAEERVVYYRNCSVARAAGAAPIRVGEPGYAGHLDRDGDGVACE